MFRGGDKKNMQEGENEHLKKLESKSIYILRETKALFKKPVVLYSMGKDSTTTLYLIKKAFNGVPFPVIHIDTGMKFPEMYQFRDRIVKELDLDLIVAKNIDAIKQGISPKTVTRFKCCTLLKTQALQQAIADYEFDAVIVSIRRDEHGIRGKERSFSPRDKEFRWKTFDSERFIGLQEAEFIDWGIAVSDFGMDVDHVRIHSLLHWGERDVWEYIKQENIPINPLYFSRGGKRYRSLGCMPCTQPFDSDAMDIDSIIEEVKKNTTGEREGRAQDKEEADAMERLRALGYM